MDIEERAGHYKIDGMQEMQEKELDITTGMRGDKKERQSPLRALLLFIPKHSRDRSPDSLFSLGLHRP